MTTANDVMNRAKHYQGTREHPAGSNHVPHITDHFGDGSWCFMYVSTVFNDLGAIDLIHGWHAYVPDFYSIFHPHGEFHTSNPKPGDLVAFDFNRTNSPEHIGIVLRVISSSLIQTIEGNTGGSGGDGVYIKTRSRSDVYAYATPKYGTNTGVDDMPTYVSLDKTEKSRQEKLTKGDWTFVYFDKNNSKGAAKHHSNGDYPSFGTGSAYYQGDVYLTIKDFADGANGQVRAAYVDGDTNAVVATCAISEFKGTKNNTYVEKSITGYVPKGQKLRIEVVNLDSETAPVVTGGQVRLMVWET
jgi:hypothetical protein